MVIHGNYPELVIPNVNFFKFTTDLIKQQGDRIAIVEASSDRQLTFREIHNASIKFASALTKRGLKKQDVVALCTSNCIEYPFIILGVAACNAITTTCNPRYTLEETKKQFVNCQPKIVVTEADQVDKMLAIAKQVPSIQEVISVDRCSKCAWLWSVVEQDNGASFPYDVQFDNQEDILLLPYSSGTTGVPKGVMITHRNFVSSVIVLQSVGKALPWVVLYSALPMFHIFGLLRMFGNMYGLKYIIDKRFHVKSFFEAVEKYKINGLMSVPAMMMEISASPLLSKYDLSSLRMITTGAAPLAPKVTLDTMQKTQAMVFQGWGLTECVVCCTLTMMNVPLSSVGFVSPNGRLKVVDPETREELGANQDGELLFDSPQVMKGYYKNPAANAVTFENGWLRTGDIGHYDENGMVYITDRMKELIKYKGFQVAPAELESLLLEHPKIRDAGVVGVPDASAGQVPRAFVVREDASLSAGEVEKFVEGKVSSYKYLRGGVCFLDEIPRSVTGKILRRNLAKLPINQSKL